MSFYDRVFGEAAETPPFPIKPSSRQPYRTMADYRRGTFSSPIRSKRKAAAERDVIAKLSKRKGSRTQQAMKNWRR